MIEIFLLWSLVGGQMHDVDAFKSEEACVEAYEQADSMLKRARLTRPDLDYKVLPCVPIKVVNPAQGEKA